MTRRELAVSMLGAVGLGTAMVKALARPRKIDEEVLDRAERALFAPYGDKSVLVVAREILGFRANHTAERVDWCPPGTMLCGRGYDLIIMTTTMKDRKESDWFYYSLVTRLNQGGKIIRT